MLNRFRIDPTPWHGTCSAGLLCVLFHPDRGKFSMKMCPPASIPRRCVSAGSAAFLTLGLMLAPVTGWAAPQAPISIPGHVCDPLPVGELSDSELKTLVPDGSPGKVRVRWATESQDNVFGFNVMRTTTEGGPYAKINRSVIPGEGTTNLPMSYCYLDTTAERGKTYWYYIEEVTLDGQRKAIEETKGKDGKGTKVTVRQVEAERTWLKERALQLAKPADAAATTAPATKAKATPAATPVVVTPKPQSTSETKKVDPLE
jgi:hypothetical protein